MKGESAALDGRIELRGVLGAGGMGEVHRAWDRALERAVAVKFFHGAAPREAERLLLEGRLQARVDHPHVVRVFDAGALRDRACLVLQLVEGRSLAELAPALSLNERVELVRQAALGVHAAHLQGLIHRDVKPGNVLVEQGPGAPRALVSDFGLARGEEPGLTRSGMVAGTLAFMSPEQILGEGPVGFAADVYGLGATLYDAVAGHPPHCAAPNPTAPANDSSDLLRRILEAPPTPLPKEVPRPLARIIAKALEKSPGSRYESAEAFAADLARFQRGEPVSARPASWAERALAWRRRNRAFARAMVAAAAALLLSAGWAVWSARRADLEALEAARLGALGEAMEAELRMEYLSPPHDLRPALAKVRAQVEALKPLAARGGGPASYALGKGLEILGDVERARAAYEQAWAKGFRIPRVAEGLGTVLGEQYRQERQIAFETLEPAAREQRLTALRAELRDPAVRHLKLADSGGWRTAFLKASIELLEGNYGAARAGAAEVLSAEPNRYEALVLEAQAHLEQAAQHKVDGHLDRGLSELDEAFRALEAAAPWGRSDPALAKMSVRARVARIELLTAQGRLPPEDVAAAEKAVARATVLLSEEDPALLKLRADLQVERCFHVALTAPPGEVVRLARETSDLYRRVLQAEPQSARVLCRLAQVLYFEASHLFKERADPGAAIEQGLAALARAEALAPSYPAVYSVRAYLLSVRANSLMGAGEPAERALREWVEAGERALRAGVRGSAKVKRQIGEALVKLGVEVWRSGRDPRPDFEKGIALLEEARRGLPKQVVFAAQTAMSHSEIAETLFAMGEDAWIHYARGLEILRDFEAAQPGNPVLKTTLAQIRFTEARQRASAGEDPRALASEIRGLLDGNPRVPGNVYLQVVLATLPVLEARWERTQGRDASALLGRAERGLGELLRDHPTEGAAWFFLARAGEERALWQRQMGLDPSPAARQGLQALAKAHQEAREPEYWAVRARLSSLAGEAAQARESLDRAWAINPLFRAGVESKAMEAELNAAAPAETLARDGEAGSSEPLGASMPVERGRAR